MPEFEQQATQTTTTAAQPAATVRSGGAIRSSLRAAGGLAAQQALLRPVQRKDVPPPLQVMPRCGGAWESFAKDFNKEFQSVLHALGLPQPTPEEKAAPKAEPAADPQMTAPEPTSTPAAPAYLAEPEVLTDPTKTRVVAAKKGSRSATDLTVERLKQLFTDKQRCLLQNFISTNEIPDRLFNGDERGGATAPQRLLISSHILARGTYKPASFEQRVHARMCFHWVQITHHYAGAGSARGPNAQGVMGSFDHAGNVVLGTGKRKSKHRGGRVYYADLPETETPGGTGPLPEGTSHALAAAKEQEKLDAKGEGGKNTFMRIEAMPWEKFDTIKPGDWLWYYNANGSKSGSHSVIFSRWATPKLETDGVKYRKAICFSQGTPKGGGREHTSWLGDQFAEVDGHVVCPITNCSSVGDSAAPVQTAEELLPRLGKTRKLSGRNAKRLARHERKLGRPIDEAKLKVWLQTQNTGHIATLEPRMTPGQKAVLEQTNQSGDLETLIRLNERLGMLVRTEAILSRNETKSHTKVDARHAEVSTAIQTFETAKAARLKEIDTELATVDAEMTALEASIDELNVSKDLRQVKRDHYRLKRKIARLRRRKPKTDEAKEALEEELLGLQGQFDFLVVQLEKLTQEHKDNRKPLRDAKRGLRAVKSRIRELGGKQAREARKSPKQKVPWAQVHPGSLRGGKESASTTGRVEKLNPQPPWAELLAEPKAPQEEPAEQ